MPAHRGAGIRHLHSNTILNVVVEIASFFSIRLRNFNIQNKTNYMHRKNKKFIKIGLKSPTSENIVSSSLIISSASLLIEEPACSVKVQKRNFIFSSLCGIFIERFLLLHSPPLVLPLNHRIYIIEVINKIYERNYLISTIKLLVFQKIYSKGYGQRQVILNTHLRIQRLGDHFSGLMVARYPSLPLLLFVASLFLTI